MPRALSATITTELDHATPDHVRLVQIGFPGMTLRYSTHQELEWDGQTWYPLGIQIDSVSAEAASLVLRNEDNFVSALVLAAPLDEVPVVIYDWYNGDAEQIFYGTLDGAPLIDNPVRLSARGHRGAPTYPTQRIAAPDFAHITPAGTVIKWGDDQLVLEVQGQ